MNGYERIMNTMENKKTDRVPVWPFVMAFSARYAGVPYADFASDYKKLSFAQIKTAEDFDLDAVVIDSDPYREASAVGAELHFPADAIPSVKRQAIEDITKFSFRQPDILKSERLCDKIEGVGRIKEHFKGEKAVVGWIEAPFQCAGTLYSMDDFFTDLYENPEFVKELLEYTCELGVRFALEQAYAGADIIGIGDAMASLVSAEVYQEFIRPYNEKLVREIRQKSKVKLKYHMCGSAAHLLGYVKEVGFDIVNIDHRTNIARADEILAGSTCIKGNINPVLLLEAKDTAEIQEACRSIFQKNIRKHILSPGCELPRDTPEGNLKALVECAKHAG